MVFFQQKGVAVLAYPYYLAARFPSAEEAGSVYFPLQQMVFAAHDDCDLSVYRIRHEGVWLVVVLGEPPPKALHLRIEAALTNGTLVTLREDVLRFLQARRSQVAPLAPWVELHHHEEEER